MLGHWNWKLKIYFSQGGGPPEPPTSLKYMSSGDPATDS